MGEKWAVFDLDGTLFNVKGRLMECLYEVGARSVDELKGQRRREFWECFLSERFMYLDYPNDEVVNELLRLKRKGVKILILTGRREDTQKRMTLMQLAVYAIPYDEIVMRKPGDFRKDHEFKAEVIKKMIEEGKEIVAVYDDSERVINKVKEILKDKKKAILMKQ